VFSQSYWNTSECQWSKQSTLQSSAAVCISLHASRLMCITSNWPPSWFSWVSHVCWSPNSIMPTFTKTSPRGKWWTQILKVADTNHLGMSRCLRQSPWQVRDKPVCVALMEFSPLQCTEKVGDKVRDTFTTKSQTCRGHKSWKSATWFVSQTFMICVRDFVRNLSWTFSQSRRNGSWAWQSTISLWQSISL